MILYHFCPAHLAARIRKQGLTLGHFPMLGDGHYSFIPDMQWLTNDPAPENQSWATRQLVTYDRTAYRLTINIPAKRTRKLCKASVFVKDLPDAQREIVDAWPGSEHWYIYKGRIPPKWITVIGRIEKGGR
jgi:hypothetical protein